MSHATALDVGMERPHKAAFSLMRLPLEIRRMIYRETLPSELKEYGTIPVFPGSPEHEEGLLRGVANPDACVGLLLANKKVHSEASDVLYDSCFVKARIGFSASNIHGIKTESPKTGSLVTPPGFHLLRNIEILILIPPWRLSTPSSFGASTLRRNLGILAKELACRCPKLRTVIVKVRCRCALQLEPTVEDRCRRTGKKKVPTSCVPAKFLEGVIQPLGRVRPSRSIEWEGECKTAAELKPIFKRLFAEIMTSVA
ncbi:MAG: hypothetical protein Q9208_003391 [Pyrenodesmia sp. 3 TL-2023]